MHILRIASRVCRAGAAVGVSCSLRVCCGRDRGTRDEACAALFYCQAGTSQLRRGNHKPQYYATHELSSFVQPGLGHPFPICHGTCRRQLHHTLKSPRFYTAHSRHSWLTIPRWEAAACWEIAGRTISWRTALDAHTLSLPPYQVRAGS
jgi:hypothetical protein